MSVARVTEIISSSKKSFEDAIEKGVTGELSAGALSASHVPNISATRGLTGLLHTILTQKAQESSCKSFNAIDLSI